MELDKILYHYKSSWGIELNVKYTIIEVFKEKREEEFRGKWLPKFQAL